MASLIDEHTQYIDPDTGLPLVNGKVYIGAQNLDPVNNPITIYSDRALGTTLSNPQTLDTSGRTTNKIWVPGTYSIRVDDSADVQKYQELDAGTSADTDINTKVSSNDTTTGYLNGKLTAGANVTFTENNNGADEDLEIAMGTSGVLIDESADHNNTPVAGKGEHWVKNDTPNRAMFTDDAGNDFYMSSPPQVANHIRAGNIQIIDGTEQSYPDTVVSTLTSAGVWETWGPTGSGATNIWTPMDSLPSEARIIICIARLSIVGTAVTQNNTVALHAALNGVTVDPGLTETRRAQLIHEGDVSGEESWIDWEVMIPLDSSQIAYMTWTFGGGGTLGVTLSYRGFITD